MQGSHVLQWSVAAVEGLLGGLVVASRSLTPAAPQPPAAPRSTRHPGTAFLPVLHARASPP